MRRQSIEYWAHDQDDVCERVSKRTSINKQTSIHLSLSALSSLNTKQPGISPTVESLTSEAQAFLAPGTELPDDFADFVGEIARAPTADLPNTAALLGGLVAQEVIEVITKQYVPIESYCTVDLVETWTGVV